VANNIASVKAYGTQRQIYSQCLEDNIRGPLSVSSAKCRSSDIVLSGINSVRE